MSRPPRKDPSPRPVDGVAPYASVVGKDPSRHYVLVSRTTPSAIEEYEHRGYTVEVASPDGPRIAGGRTVQDGEELCARSMVLMSCSRERHEEIVAVGEDGRTGLALADKVEERIIDRKRGGFDQLRGLIRTANRDDDYFGLEYKTRAAQLER